MMLRSRIVSALSLLVAMSGSYASAGAPIRLFFVPEGVDPATATPGMPFESTVDGGSSIVIEAFAENGTVQEYEIAWPCALESSIATRPPISSVAGSANISTTRPDYVFNGAPGFPNLEQGQCDANLDCVSPAQCPGSSTCVDNFCTVESPVTGALSFVPIDFPGAVKYIGDLTFDVPADAGGTYNLAPFCTPDDGCPETLTSFDSGNSPFVVDTLNITIEVGDCCAGSSCTADVTESECDNLGGVFRSGGDCSANCECVFDGDCNDDNACTVDSCAGVSATCSNGSFADESGCCNIDQTPPGLCCNIANGDVVDPDDNIPCTTDSCDDNGLAVHTPLPDGPATECDDGSACTADECLNGTCTNTDITEVACITVDDCPSVAGSCENGFCFCVENPALCINAIESGGGDQLCVSPDDIITFDVETGFSTSLVCGAQFFLQYDSSALELIDMIKGADTGNPNSEVFNTLLFAAFDPFEGTIDYAIGDSPIQPCSNATNGPATIARLVFRAIGDCLVENPICFREHNPETSLGSVTALRITPSACDDPSAPVTDTCSPDVNIITPSNVSCPFDGRVTVPADCGLTKSTVLFDPITISDNCTGELTPECTVFYHPQCEDSGDCGGADCGTINPGFCDVPIPSPNSCNDPALAETGGQFCKGLTVVACQASASCGGGNFCNFEIENTGRNQVVVDLEMSPTLVEGSAFDPLVRCIEFSVARCGDAVAFPTIVNAEVEFGHPGNIAGHGVAMFDIPAGNRDCITARDPWHSLGSSCGLECVDNAYHATFKGSPEFSDCHWLVNGNLNGDRVIDILDFVTFMSIGSQFIDPDTSCDMEHPSSDGTGQKHGDINGDGIVDLLDFSFVSVNLFEDDKDGCNPVCGVPTSPQQWDGPRTDVSIRELLQRGFDINLLRSIDVNNDHRISLTDVAGAMSTSNVLNR